MNVILERRRKPGLGTYNASRKEWQMAWQFARTMKRCGVASPMARFNGVWWKAQLIRWYERDSPDPLEGSAECRLSVRKWMDDFLGEKVSP